MQKFEMKRKASPSVVANSLASMFGTVKTGDFEATIDTLIDLERFPFPCRLHAWEEEVWQFLRNPDVETNSLGQGLYLEYDEMFVVKDKITSGKDSLWLMFITDTLEESLNNIQRKGLRPLTIINKIPDTRDQVVAMHIKTL